MRHQTTTIIFLSKFCMSSALATCVLISGCINTTVPLGRNPTLSAGSLDVGSIGDWRGTTSQGTLITFTVSADETITHMSIGYNFEDCIGTRVFRDVGVSTAPDVTCLPGPCSDSVASYRAFGFSDGVFDAGPYTQINGVFLPGNRAQGQAVFSGYPGCDRATAQWTAIRRPVAD